MDFHLCMHAPVYFMRDGVVAAANSAGSTYFVCWTDGTPQPLGMRIAAPIRTFLSVRFIASMHGCSGFEAHVQAVCWTWRRGHPCLQGADCGHGQHISGVPQRMRQGDRTFASRARCGYVVYACMYVCVVFIMHALCKLWLGLTSIPPWFRLHQRASSSCTMHST